MDKALNRVRNKFTLLSIGLAIFCAVLGSIGLYSLSEVRLNNQINASKISKLTSSDPAVQKYLATQEPYHAHFESIANAIQKDNQQQLTRNLVWIVFIASLISGLAGWVLSRRLLIPVKDSFLSQRRFMQDAAHELRNPLAALKTMVQQARRKPPKEAPLRNLLTSMDGQLERLSAITTDLLLLERRDNPGTQKTDIVALTKDILEEFHGQAMEKKLQVEVNAPEKLEVKIDPQHFVYIAKNIIENAIKFSDIKKPEVTINIAKKTDGWVMTVKDNGIGIPKKDIDNITKRFYRGSNVNTVNGTGLGLAIVTKFVDIYKGSFKVQSTAGKGTTVSVEI